MLSPLAQGHQKGQLGAEAQAKAAKGGWGRQSSDLRLNSPLDRESDPIAIPSLTLRICSKVPFNFVNMEGLPGFLCIRTTGSIPLWSKNRI